MKINLDENFEERIKQEIEREKRKYGAIYPALELFRTIKTSLIEEIHRIKGVVGDKIRKDRDLTNFLRPLRSSPQEVEWDYILSEISLQKDREILFEEELDCKGIEMYCRRPLDKKELSRIGDQMWDEMTLQKYKGFNEKCYFDLKRKANSEGTSGEKKVTLSYIK